MLTSVEHADLLGAGPLRPVSEIAMQATGRRPAPATTWRWCKLGTRRGVLPAVRVYGSWHTTAAAFRAWLHVADRADTSEAGRAETPLDDMLTSAGLL